MTTSKVRAKTATKLQGTKGTRTVKRRTAKAGAIPAAAQAMPAQPPVKISGFRALMIHPLAGQSGFALRSWIALLAVATFALAMGSGIVQTANMVGQEVSTERTVPHRSGRVAGATVNLAPGVITVIVQQNAKNQTTYQLTATEPLSVFNLFRVASATTALKTDIATGSNGAAVTSVNGIPSTVQQPWRVLVNNSAPASFDEPVIMPGASVTLTLAP